MGHKNKAQRKHWHYWHLAASTIKLFSSRLVF
jgi:hypothetical protein